MFDDNYLTIRKWVPNFLPSDSPMRYLTAWVRIPHLSVEYFNQEFLRKIRNKIGKVTRIDHNTAFAQRGQFTRLSVELDLSQPLLSKFWFKGKIWKIQYEGLRMICFNCGKIGHLEEKCPIHMSGHNSEVPPMHEEGMDITPEISPSPQPDENHDFGAWMMVKKPPPRRRNIRSDVTRAPLGKKPTTTPMPEVPKSKIGGLNFENSKDKTSGSRFEILEDMQNLSDKEKNPVESEIISSSTPEVVEETVDLGKSSQIPPKVITPNPFHIGTDNPPC